MVLPREVPCKLPVCGVQLSLGAMCPVFLLSVAVVLSMLARGLGLRPGLLLVLAAAVVADAADEEGRAAEEVGPFLFQRL